MEFTTKGLAWLKERAEEIKSKFEDEEFKPEIAVFQLYNKKLVVVESQQGMGAIHLTAFNSKEFVSEHEDYAGIWRVIGIKPVTEERTLSSVVEKLTKQAGKGNVYGMAGI